MVLLSTALEALGVRPQPLGTTAPSSPATGQTWVDSSGPSPVLKVWTGSTWVSTAGGGGGSTTAIGTTAPSSPTTGQIWLDTTTTPPVQKIWTGSGWVTPSGGGGGSLSMPLKFTEVRFSQGSNSAKLLDVLDFNGSDLVSSSNMATAQTSSGINAASWPGGGVGPEVAYLVDPAGKWAMIKLYNNQYGYGNGSYYWNIYAVEVEQGFSTSGPVSMLLA